MIDNKILFYAAFIVLIIVFIYFMFIRKSPDDEVDDGNIEDSDPQPQPKSQSQTQNIPEPSSINLNNLIDDINNVSVH
jgi:hypothetical protein